MPHVPVNVEIHRVRNDRGVGAAVHEVLSPLSALITSLFLLLVFSSVSIISLNSEI